MTVHVYSVLRTYVHTYVRTKDDDVRDSASKYVSSCTGINVNYAVDRQIGPKWKEVRWVQKRTVFLYLIAFYWFKRFLIEGF